MREIIKVVTCLIGLGVAVAQADISPRELIVQTNDRMTSAMRADRAQIEQHPEHLYRLVEDIVVPHIDFQRIARWVLGKYWRRASPAQRSRFTAEFRTLLVHTYAAAWYAYYADQQVRVLPQRGGAGQRTKAVVRTEVSSPSGPPITIHYSFYQNGGEWKVYDVRIDGVSLVTNYRSSFSNSIRRAGLDKLIVRLAAKNHRTRP